MENKQISGFWYILPVLFGIIGGVIAWAVNKKHDSKKAVSFLWVGGIITVVTVVLFFLLVFTVTTSLDGARSEAKDANIMSTMRQLRSLSEIEHAMRFSYANVSCSFGEVAMICEGLESLTGQPPVIHSSIDEYCAYAELQDGYFCIDSMGSADKTDVFPGGSGHCDGVTFFCPAPVVE